MNAFIESSNQWGTIFTNVGWPMLWQSSLLIAALFTIDILFRRKIRASIRYALWLVVLVKLCLPPALALPTGPAWWLFPSKAADRTRPVTKYVVTYDTTAANEAVQQTVPTFVPRPTKLDAAGWTLLGCGLVSVGLLLWLAFRWWQISRNVSCATASAEQSGLLEEIQSRAGLRLPLRLKLVDGQMSPAVCGLLRPVILLPRVLAEQLSAEQLRAVLLHEAFHLRRKDVWVNCAQALLQIVYWWHPLLWLANARIRRLREEAVDDAVMLALRDKAESYAPTLLAVAKLAFSRPLMSLGLVGIMESRSALRKRIERLVNFTAPRKAGLTFLSLCGIFIFSAVALPMGPAPVSAPESFPGDAASVETTLTVKVDPEVFIRNVKAHADWTISTGTNDYTEILLGLLHSEGVNCNPPHGIAFNTKTGEMTMQNTPEQLEVFRRVIEQLNRADGKAELPLRDSPIHRQSILIEGRFFWISSDDFDRLIQGLHAYAGWHGGAPWWSVAPETIGEFNNRIKSLGLKPFTSPRVQTLLGIEAEMFCGTQTNGVEFDCRPMAIQGGIDLAFRMQITDDPTFKNHTLVGINQYQMHGMASAEDCGGIVLRADQPNGSGADLVLVVQLQSVTNNPPPHFAQRLQAIIIRSNNAIATPESSSPTQGATANPAGFAERVQVAIPDNATSADDSVRDAKVLYEMGKLDEAETKLKAALALNPGNAAARYYADLVAEAKSGQPSRATGTERRAAVLKLSRLRLENVSFQATPLGEVLRQLAEQARANDPEGAVVNLRTDNGAGNAGNQPTIDPNSGLPVAQDDSADINSVPITIDPPLQNTLLVDALDAIVKGARHPIRYGVQSDGSVVFSALTSQLITRTFRIDPNTFLAGLRRQVPSTGTGSQEVFKALKQLFSDAGVDLQSPKAVFYNDRLGMIFVRATADDLDKIESIIARLNTMPAQIHIKAWFMEVPKQGFVWPVAETSGQISEATGILNAEQAQRVRKMLAAKAGFEILAEPEGITGNGGHMQMRATQIMNIVTNFTFWETATHAAMAPETGNVETGSVLDTVTHLLPDGYTIDLKTTALVTTFWGYADSTNISPYLVTNSAGEKIALPVVLPAVQIERESARVKLYDGQTLVLSGLQPEHVLFSKPDRERDQRIAEHIQQAEATSKSEMLVVLVTATLVEPAGNRVHTDDEMPFAQKGVPPQAY